METAQSLSVSLHLCIFPPNPFNANLDKKQIFRTEASSGNAVTRRNGRIKDRTDNHHSFSPRRDALPRSLPHHRKNPQAIYKDIKKFAREDKLKEALTVMDYMDQQGIPVNATTFSALIAACIRSKCLTQAKEIHAHLRIHGLERNEFLRTKVVQMYTSCGSIEDAQRVFDECSSSSISVYPWNALLRGTVVSGGKRYLDVLATYQEMRELGVELNVYTFSNVLKSFAGASALKQGLKAHALLIKKGIVEHQILGTSLVDMYFKCGKIKLAHRVFEEMREKDIVLWGAMIAGFAHNRRQWQALDYVRWMISERISPNSVILTTILPIIGELCEKRLGKEVHACVIKTSYSEQLPVHCGLVDMYCKCGDIGSGRRVFYGSKKRNTVMWTALTSGYISNGSLEQALRSVIWMQQEGFRPDVVTVATVVPVCAELRDLNHGKELHAYAVKRLFFPNVSITTSLIKMYSKCGVLDYSIKLFNGLEKRNVHSWTAMIDTYLEHGCVNDGLSLFRSMQLSKHRPDSVTMARMLNVCGEIKALRLGKEIHGHILKKDFESIPFVSAEIVKMYGCCGLMHSAMTAFKAIPVKGSRAWTAIIESCGFNKQWKDAIHLFDEMIRGGFTPSHFTFNVVLSICDQAGLADDACRIFKLMSQRYELKATEKHYSIIIGLLTRSGRIAEAQRYIKMRASLPSS